MPKNLKGETFWAFRNFSLLQNIKKLEGGPFDKKSRTVPKKIQTEDPIVSSGFVSYVKKGLKERGPFALTQMRFRLPVQ